MSPELKLFCRFGSKRWMNSLSSWMNSLSSWTNSLSSWIFSTQKVCEIQLESERIQLESEWIQLQSERIHFHLPNSTRAPTCDKKDHLFSFFSRRGTTTKIQRETLLRPLQKEHEDHDQSSTDDELSILAWVVSSIIHDDAIKKVKFCGSLPT